MLILGLLPLASIAIMIGGIMYLQLNFYGYITVIIVSGITFLSVWFFAVLNGEDQKVELSMYIVVGIVVLFSMASFALVEVLPNDILESFLRTLISKGDTYDIWSRSPYQIAHFVIMVASFPYVASFVISKSTLKFKSYHNQKNRILS